MGIETALIGLAGSALGAGANIFGASQAGRAQTNATNAAIQQQMQGRTQAQNLLAPFIMAGQDVMTPLRNFIDPNFSGQGAGLNTLMRLIQPGADQNALLAQTPGYQFSLDQGNRAVMNRLNARGLGGSAGAVAKGVANYTQGLASTTWKDVVDRLQAAFSSGSGAMQNMAGMGANAANQLAGGILGSSNSIANNMTGLGNAQAGMWTGIGGAIGQFGNNASQLAMLRGLGGGGGGGGSMYGAGGGTGFDVNPWSGGGMFGPGGSGWA